MVGEVDEEAEAEGHEEHAQPNRREVLASLFDEDTDGHGGEGEGEDKRKKVDT